jgi:acetyl esterase/lipase
MTEQPAPRRRDVSLRARFCSRLVRRWLKRRRAADPAVIVDQARRRFGVPAPLGWLCALGLCRAPLPPFPRGGDGLRARRAAPLDAAVLYFHGGGYVGSSPWRHRPLTAALARCVRLPVLVPCYRLAPEHPFPAAVDDCLAAYRALLASGRHARRIAFAGDSAGGGLVFATLLAAKAARLPMPAGVAAFSPWVDLEGTGASLQLNEAVDDMFFADDVPGFARLYLGDHSPRDPLASPIHGDFTGCPPVLLHVSCTEILLDDARRLHAAARSAGVDATLRVFPPLPHGWQMYGNLVPEARTSLREAAAFLRGCVRADEAAPSR